MYFKPQYSEGDQGPNKKEFWKSDMKKCPKCEKSNIQQKTDCCGCRHNGDGYGVELFTCLDCGWKTSFQYDEAGDCHYYETRDWKR